MSLKTGGIIEFLMSLRSLFTKNPKLEGFRVLVLLFPPACQGWWRVSGSGVREDIPDGRPLKDMALSLSQLGGSVCGCPCNKSPTN